MRQLHLFLHKSEALAAKRAGVLGAAELEALSDDRPFSYVMRGENFIGTWGNAILHPVKMLPPSSTEGKRE